MTDNYRQNQNLDSSRININERWEIDYWCERLGVSAEKLRSAVKTVGPNANDVVKHLKK